MASLLIKGATLAEIEIQEAQKTADTRWNELTTPPTNFFGALAAVTGGLVVAGALGGNGRAIPAF